jgi:hypothetical protein
MRVFKDRFRTLVAATVVLLAAGVLAASYLMVGLPQPGSVGEAQTAPAPAPPAPAKPPAPGSLGGTSAPPGAVR